MAYLVFETWKLRSSMSDDDADDLEQRYPGYIAARIALREGWINGKLRKRYAAPFAAPVPDVVLGWLEAMVTLDAYKKRGFNPSSEQDRLIVDAEAAAKTEVTEAADSEEGKFDLPLRQDTTATGVSKGGPLGYSEVSPYTWTDRQREALSHGE